MNGVEIGDAERVGDQRSRTGAAPRSYRDTLLPRPGDELHDDEKVAGKAHLVDDIELEFKPRAIRFFIDLVSAEYAQFLEPALQSPTRRFGQVLF